jgi:DNA-binding NarL/FixJ family response regulator
VAEGRDSLEDEAEKAYRDLDYPRALRLYEQAFAAYRAKGEALASARVARILAWLHGNVYGAWAVGSGWTTRACTLLEGAEDDSAEHGWALAMQAPAETDPARQERLLREAMALGRRHREPALEFEAEGWLGLLLVREGRVDEGFTFFDEAMAAVCAGEVSDVYVVEGTFCGMFFACERVNDVIRAEQWLSAAADVVNRPHMGGVSAFCRAHYGGILTAAGRWEEAEFELTNAARLFEGTYTAMRSAALARLGDLRVRQGRFEEAVQLLEGLEEHPDAARPLAALQLARGHADVARDLLERTLGDRGVLAPMPGPLLALLVDVHLARGAVEDAARVATELAELAARQSGRYLHAAAALARGKVCIASDSGDARTCLHNALSLFAQAQMPVELAQARLELARAVAAERPQVALAEAAAALESFERLQAARDADAAAALLRDLGGPARTGPKTREPLTKREAEVLTLLGHGLTNSEIGDRLYISRKTVEHHVGRVLSKLGLRSRAEAAAYVVRTATKEDKPGSE